MGSPMSIAATVEERRAEYRMPFQPGLGVGADGAEVTGTETREGSSDEEEEEDD